MLSELRQAIARMQRPAVAIDASGDCALGVAEIDRALGGGLARGTLHEIAACGEAHTAAATGFALGVAALCHSGGALPLPLGERDHAALAIDFHAATHAEMCACLNPQAGRGKGKAVVWVAEDMALLESGVPYGPGLDLFGLAPERLLTVAGAKACDVLWAMEEALHCRAVSVVVGEVRSASHAVDLVATRRLSLAAAAHGALALLLRTMPGTEASTAATRWIVRAASSKASKGIGPPRFDVALTRNRRGPLGSWMLEWSLVDASFTLATHSEPMARTAADRPDTRAA
jgi:protein ImuA